VRRGFGCGQEAESCVPIWRSAGPSTRTLRPSSFGSSPLLAAPRRRQPAARDPHGPAMDGFEQVQLANEMRSEATSGGPPLRSWTTHEPLGAGGAFRASGKLRGPAFNLCLVCPPAAAACRHPRRWLRQLRGSRRLCTPGQRDACSASHATRRQVLTCRQRLQLSTNVARTGKPFGLTLNPRPQHRRLLLGASTRGVRARRCARCGGQPLRRGDHRGRGRRPGARCRGGLARSSARRRRRCFLCCLHGAPCNHDKTRAAHKCCQQRLTCSGLCACMHATHTPSCVPCLQSVPWTAACATAGGARGARGG
jgi:hypothetical protein